MVTQSTSAVRWTTRDIEVLPQNEWTTYEIIDGELFVTRSPHRRHQRVIGKLHRALDEWSDQSGLGEPIIDAGLILSDADNVITDLVWASKETIAEFEDEAGHLTRVPELVVEVLSYGADDVRRDREAKLKLYSVKGAQEYWIADRRSKQLEIYRRRDVQLTLHTTLGIGDTLTSPLLPEFNCPVDQLFS
ncbi:MAG: Uma2 family endonuclease [Cyanobacteria bacterium J06634_6]